MPEDIDTRVNSIPNTGSTANVSNAGKAEEHNANLLGSLSRVIKGKFKERYVFSFIIYLIIALIIFAPITASMSHIAPGTGGDTFQNLWDIWWVDYATFTLHT